MNEEAIIRTLGYGETARVAVAAEECVSEQLARVSRVSSFPMFLLGRRCEDIAGCLQVKATVVSDCHLLTLMRTKLRPAAVN